MDLESEGCKKPMVRQAARTAMNITQKTVDYFFFTLANCREKGNPETRIFDGPETSDSTANHTRLSFIGTCLEHPPASNLRFGWKNE